MANAIELLLNANKEGFERPSKVVEIPRLSKILGDKFEVKCKALTMNKTNSLRMECANQKTGEIDIAKLQVKTLIEGVFTIDDKSFFRNTELKKQFKAPNSEELINILFIAGEVDYLFETITDLGELDLGIEDEIKN